MWCSSQPTSTIYDLHELNMGFFKKNALCKTLFKNTKMITYLIIRMQRTMQVVEQMQEAKFFGAFKKSSYYIRLLIELELITEPREPSLKSDEDLDSVGLSLGICSYGSGDDSASLNSLEPGSDEVEFLTPPPDELLAGSATAPTLPLTGDSAAAESYLCAAIYNTGIVRRGASTYALYAISVTKLEPNQMEAKWCVFRRYSDFYEFHSKLQRQVGVNCDSD